MAKVEVDIELKGIVIHRQIIEIPDDALGMFTDDFAGINIRSYIDREIVPYIKTKWRYAEPFTDDDKAFASLIGEAAVIPKKRMPRKRQGESDD